MIAGLAVGASALWGVADFLGGVSTRRWSVARVGFLGQASALLVVTGVWLLVPSTPTAPDFAWGAAAGLATAIGLALLYWALGVGPMSTVAPVAAVVSLALPAAVAIFDGDVITGPLLIGVVLAVISVWLVSPSPGYRDGARPRISGRLLVAAVVAGAGIGAANTCFAQTSESSGLSALVSAKVVAVVILAAMCRRGDGWPSRNATNAAASGLADAMASVCLIVALQRGSLIVVAVLASLFPAVTVLLATAVLKESFVPRQRMGLAAAVMSIALMST